MIKLLLLSYKKMINQTNLNNVFLAGVVCGGMNTHSLFIENFRVHAEHILKEITFNNFEMRAVIFLIIEKRRRLQYFLF